MLSSPDLGLTGTNDRTEPEGLSERMTPRIRPRTRAIESELSSKSAPPTAANGRQNFPCSGATSSFVSIRFRPFETAHSSPDRASAGSRIEQIRDTRRDLLGALPAVD